MCVCVCVCGGGGGLRSQEEFAISPPFTKVTPNYGNKNSKPLIPFPSETLKVDLIFPRLKPGGEMETSSQTGGRSPSSSQKQAEGVFFNYAPEIPKLYGPELQSIFR